MSSNSRQVERFEAAVSQSAVPSPPLKDAAGEAAKTLHCRREGLRIYIYIYIHIYICIIYIYIHIYIYTHMYICIVVVLDTTCIHMCIYIYIYIYVHRGLRVPRPPGSGVNRGQRGHKGSFRGYLTTRGWRGVLLFLVSSCPRSLRGLPPQTTILRYWPLLTPDRRAGWWATCAATRTKYYW